MPIDFSATPDDDPTRRESDTPMFAPVPAWERGKKRRGFGSGRASAAQAGPVAEEPRSFAAEPQSEREMDTLAGDQRDYAFDPIEPAATAGDSAFPLPPEGESAFSGTPTYVSASAGGRSNAAPMVVAAGIILLGGLGAAGWYVSQTHNAGMAQLTPGSTTTTTTATTAAPPVQTAENATPQAALPAASASAAAPPAAPEAAAPPVGAHTTTTTTATTHNSPTGSVTHKTTVARARPASRSAEDVGANASATLPASPQPYQPSSQAAPTPTAPPVLNVPTTVHAAPAPTPEPPASTAAPAPTQSVPAPPTTTTTPPATPPTQTTPPPSQ